MKKLLSTQMYLFLSILIISNVIYAKDVTVSGTVKADATGQPISEAMVTAFGASLDMSSMPDSIDTIVTGSDGTFEMTITVADNANVLFYGGFKDGYLAKTDIKQYILQPMPTAVNVGDILLKTMADATDTLQVSGTVVDSITREPLPNTKIRVTSGLIGDITIDSLTSDAQGNFEGKIPYIPGTNPLFKAIFYAAEKDGYVPKGDTAGIPDNEIIDLGTIELVENTNPIKHNLQPIKILQPTHVAVYSVQGKLLYKGLINNYSIPNKLKTSNQQIIVRYYRNNKLLGVIKNLQLK